MSCSSTHHHRQHHPQQPQQQQADSDVFGAVVAPSATVLCFTDSTGSNYQPALPSSRLSSSCALLAAEFDRSQQTPVIVAPGSSGHVPLRPPSVVVRSPSASSSTSTSSVFTAANLYDSAVSLAASAPCITAQSCCYHLSDESCTATAHSPIMQPSCSASSTPSFIYPSNFFQPYYGLSPTLSEFNVLQMCCQPLFTEVCFLFTIFYICFNARAPYSVVRMVIFNSRPVRLIHASCSIDAVHFGMSCLKNDGVINRTHVAMHQTW
ncbi:unnamed protein product [Gongylonema pulchrum]|uniref:Uncharacterized protein n=1 Tax=Gongylonema pulchrum TaxID=637853 RepID=A0A183E596_9BILA|nr:unnamed protein product [Gongylonema pulchrum]